jgi:hypothetical protein
MSDNPFKDISENFSNEEKLAKKKEEFAKILQKKAYKDGWTFRKHVYYENNEMIMKCLRLMSEGMNWNKEKNEYKVEFEDLLKSHPEESFIPEYYVYYPSWDYYFMKNNYWWYEVRVHSYSQKDNQEDLHFTITFKRHLDNLPETIMEKDITNITEEKLIEAIKKGKTY